MGAILVTAALERARAMTISAAQKDSANNQENQPNIGTLANRTGFQGIVHHKHNEEH